MTPAQARGRAILLMVFGSGVLAMHDAAIKWLTESIPVSEIMAVRSAMILAIILGIALARRRLQILRVTNWRGQVLRGSLFVATAYLFFTALKLMPLADATAITFASPLFMAMLAVPLLKENLGWSRGLAVLLGFIGVMLVVEPAVLFGGGGGGGREPQSNVIFLLPLSVALLMAFRDLLTRHLSVSETSLGMLFFTNAAVCLGGLVLLPFTWTPLTLKELAWLGISAVMVGLAHFLQTESFRLAPATTVAPFRYSAIVWAILFGAVVWGAWPSPVGWLGVGTIVASSLYVWHRERKAIALPAVE